MPSSMPPVFFPRMVSVSQGVRFAQFIQREARQPELHPGWLFGRGLTCNKGILRRL
jgi:hypothetical protein